MASNAIGYAVMVAIARGMSPTLVPQRPVRLSSPSSSTFANPKSARRTWLPVSIISSDRWYDDSGRGGGVGGYT